VARVEINPEWRGQLAADWTEFADGRLGGDIADDARRYCPVRTGALKASIEHHLEGEDLIISAAGGGEDDAGNLYVSRRQGRVGSGGTHLNPGRNVGSHVTREVHHVDADGRTYAAYLELGHRQYHPSTGETGPEFVAPRPFLRPALFTSRSE
jgi:hypothetical protein